MKIRMFAPVCRAGLALALSVALVGLTVSCSKKEQSQVREVARPVKMLTLTGGGEGATRVFTGMVRASRRADLAFKVMGPLVELPAEEGQQVRREQLLAKIDPRDFQSSLDGINSTLQEAQARLRAMKAGARPEEIQALRAAVDAAKAQLTNAEEQYKRYKDLYVKRQVSQAEFDRYKSQFDVAKANMTTQEQALEVGQSGARVEDIEAMEASIRGLESQAKKASDALGDTRLLAPFDGVVAKRFVENFEEVQAKQAIISLQDISELEVVIQVPEMLMAQVKHKKKRHAEAEFAAAPGRRFPVSIKEFAAEADPRTQTYEVTLRMEQPEGVDILPGMTANVHATAAPDDDAADGPLTIPAAAVFGDEKERSLVWIVDQATMTVSERQVRTGDLVGNASIVVLEGLAAGETIAVTGVAQLRSGMEVTDLAKLEGYGK
jgi:RND family efflux transporter MFP subunit